MPNPTAGAAAAEEKRVLAGGDGDGSEDAASVGDEATGVQEEEERGVEGEAGGDQRGDAEDDRRHAAAGKGGEGESLFVGDDDVVGAAVSAEEKTVTGGRDCVGADWLHGLFVLLPVDSEDGAGGGTGGVECAGEREDVGSAVHSVQFHVTKES